MKISFEVKETLESIAKVRERKNLIVLLALSEIMTALRTVKGKWYVCKRIEMP